MCTEDGKVILQLPLPLREKIGYPSVVLERSKLLDVLMSGIKDKSKCLARSSAVSFKEDESKVQVTCSDGTVYDCDVLVGADGVHSRVREFMMDELEKTELKEIASESRKGVDIFCLMF